MLQATYWKKTVTRAKRLTKSSFEFNEAQGRGDMIVSSIERDMNRGTDPNQYDEGEINTRYEITVIVRELGDWDKT